MASDRVINVQAGPSIQSSILTNRSHNSQESLWGDDDTDFNNFCTSLDVPTNFDEDSQLFDKPNLQSQETKKNSWGDDDDSEFYNFCMDVDVPPNFDEDSQLFEKPISVGDDRKENVVLEHQSLISTKNNILLKLEEEYNKINSTWCELNSHTAALDWVKRAKQQLQEWGLDFNVIHFLFQYPKFISPQTCNCSTHLSMSTLDDFKTIKISPQNQVMLQLQCELRQLKLSAIDLENNCKSLQEWMQKAKYIFESLWSITPEVSNLLLHKLIHLK